MSDILDIETHSNSEFGDESEQLTNFLKMNAKIKKGRGFDSLLCTSTKDKFKLSYDLRCGLRSLKGIQPQKSVEGYIIFVRGIHEEATEDDIKDLFSEYGQISNFNLNLDRRTGFIKGYAIIEYKTFTEALNTIENLNGAVLLGQSISVDWAFIKKGNLVYGHC